MKIVEDAKQISLEHVAWPWSKSCWISQEETHNNRRIFRDFEATTPNSDFSKTEIFRSVFFFKCFFWWVVLRPSAHGSIHPPAALDGENRSPSSKGYALGLSETRGMAWLKSPLKKKNDIDRSWDSNRYPGPSTRLMKKLQFVTKQGFHLRNVWTNFILKQIKTLMLRMKRNFRIPRITSD